MTIDEQHPNSAEAPPTRKHATPTEAPSLGSRDTERGIRRGRWGRWWVWSVAEVRWATGATALFAAGGMAQLAGGPAWLWWGLYLGCYAAGGWEPGWAGLQALRQRRLDVDLLMVLAAVGAASIGQVLDGGLLIVIFATSGALEAVATRRTEDSVRGLLDLAPQQASRIGLDGREELVDTTDLVVGDVIVVRPGERIGADGRVIDGASEVDQASITGEPMPADKLPGDDVFAGTINGTGMLRVQVDRRAADSVVARIVAMVREASTTKARTQLFVEKVEQRYSVGMVAATVALFVVPLVFGAALQPTLLRAMTFMIVASPCAVVLATMPPLLSAIANAGRHGVLVKSAQVMEQLGTVTRVAFDKTGTLTEGAPHLAEIHILPPAGIDGSQLDERELLTLAASVENPSEHPLARAVVAAAHRAGLSLRHADEFTSAPGRGVHAHVSSRCVEVGRPDHLLAPALGTPCALHRSAAQASAGGREDDDSLDGGPAARGAATAVAGVEESGNTAVLVRVDGCPVAVLGLADRLRPDAAGTASRLTALTGVSPLLLTGDNPRTAHHLAGQVGISEVHARLLPQDKVAIIKQAQAGQVHRLLHVGDGVNDAPALATAHTGIAMGRAGSDLALDTADAVIVRDELATIPAVIALSRRARRLVAANLVIAATFITGLVIWDLAGHLPLPLGVAGHEGSTVIVGLNGLRLLRNAAWTTGRGRPISADQ